MKKVLMTVAALGMVAGVASTASAVDFSVKGEYWAAGVNLSDANGTGMRLTDNTTLFDPLTGAFTTGALTNIAPGVIPGTTTSGYNATTDRAVTGSDAYFAHEMKMIPTMKINDKSSIIADLRFIDTSIWGSQDSTNTNNGRTFDVNKLYVQYLSPVGKLEVGRRTGGQWGHDFLNHNAPADRIQWWPNFLPAPWSLVAVYQKSTEGDAPISTATGVPTATDADSDLYVLGVGYKADMFNVDLGYFLFDNALAGDAGTVGAPGAFDRMWHRFDLSGSVKFAGFYLDAELVHDFGDWSDFDAAAARDVDIDTWGAMAKVGTKMAGFDLGLLYFYASGDEPGDTASPGGDMTGILRVTGPGNIGKDFAPYYILTGSDSAMLVNDHQAASGAMVASGVQSIGLLADYQVTDKLSLHGAVAKAWADEENGAGHVINAAGFAVVDRDDDYGWEIDLGAAYKLLDNLTYSVHFGYLASGDYFAAQPYTLVDSNTADVGANILPTIADVNGDGVADNTATGDTNDVYQLVHKLSMTF
ncbi:MAG: hypothetical protein AB1634_18630 [Thermodesulfobacteriota bacterium]